MDDLDNKYQNDEMKNQWKNMIWHWSKMDLYLSKHLSNDGTFGESAWKQPGDDVKQRNSSGSAKIETLKTAFKVFTKISPYQIRHGFEGKQKDWRSPQMVPISIQYISCQNKPSKRHSEWTGKFFWGVFCGDARTTGCCGCISWVCKFVGWLW